MERDKPSTTASCVSDDAADGTDAPYDARMRTPQLIGMITLASIWGASFMFIKVMLDGIGPIAIAWVRLGGGATLVLAVAAARGAYLPRGGRVWLDIALLALLASAIPLVLIPWGEQEIDSALAGVLNGAMPFFVAVLAHQFLAGERLNGPRSVGLALGFAGLVVVIGPDLLDVASESTQGQLAVVVATLGYASGAVLTRRRLLGVDSTLLAGAQSAIAFAMLTPLLLTFESVPRPSDLSSRVLLASVGLALLSSGVAYIIYYWLLATVAATQAALVTYLIPAAAIFWGWLVLSEGMALSVAPGLALIVAGVYLVNRSPAARAPAARARGGAERSVAARGGGDGGSA